MLQSKVRTPALVSDPATCTGSMPVGRGTLVVSVRSAKGASKCEGDHASNRSRRRRSRSWCTHQPGLRGSRRRLHQLCRAGATGSVDTRCHVAPCRHRHARTVGLSRAFPWVFTPDLASIATIPPPLMAMRVAADARVALDSGFTSVREVGGMGVWLTRAIEEGTVNGPTVYGAGAVLEPNGRARRPPHVPGGLDLRPCGAIWESFGSAMACRSVSARSDSSCALARGS